MNITAEESVPRTAVRDVQTSRSEVEAQHLVGFRPWKDFVHDNFPWLEHRDHSCGDFRAQVRAYRCSGAVLSSIRASASEVIRTRQLAEASDIGYIKLMWQRSGELHVEQDGRRCTLSAGQVAVCDTTRPYRVILAGSASFAVLMLAHDGIPGWQGMSQQVCGTRLVDSASTRGALGALTTLMELPGEVVRSEGEPVLRAVRWMLSAALQRSNGRGLDYASEDARLDQVRRHILEHIGDPTLNVNTLASALCMSRRSLYSLFSGQLVTPTKLINDLRLDQAFQQLESTKSRPRKITDIAFDLGFSDYATFSRLFKARFGVCPNAHRRGRISQC